MNPVFSELATSITQRAQRVSDGIKLVGAIIGEDPAIIPDLIKALQRAAADSGAPKPTRQRGSPNFDKLRAFFESQSNHWHSVDEIAAGSGLTADAVRQSIYKSSKDNFDSRSHPADSRARQFRLKGSQPTGHAASLTPRET